MSQRLFMAPPRPSITGISIGPYQIRCVNGVADVTDVDSATRSQMTKMKWKGVPAPAGYVAPPASPSAEAQKSEATSALTILQELDAMDDAALKAECERLGCAVPEEAGREILLEAAHAARLEAARQAAAASEQGAGAGADATTTPKASDGAQSDGTIAQTDAAKAGATGATGATGAVSQEEPSPRRKRAPAASFEQ